MIPAWASERLSLDRTPAAARPRGRTRSLVTSCSKSTRISACISAAAEAPELAHGGQLRGRTPDCPVGQLGAWLDGRPLEDATLASYLAELHEPGPGAGEASTAVAAVCCRACLAGEPSPSDRCDRKPGASAAIRGGNHVRPGPEGTAARPSVGLKARPGAISVVRGLTPHRFRSGVCTVPAADGQPAQCQSRLRPPAELGAVGSPAGWTMPH